VKVDESRPMTTKKAIVLEAVGDFWCEAAVLVAVFGLLDRIMRHEELTLSWSVGAVASAFGLLAVGIGVKIWSRT
jgi:hypothetical protein